MKSTGVVRRIDDLGRVVLPMELRRTLGIEPRDAVEVYVNENQIILQKYEHDLACQVTGEISRGNLELAGGKIRLSPDAAKLLLIEIEKQLSLQEA